MDLLCRRHILYNTTTPYTRETIEILSSSYPQLFLDIVNYGKQNPQQAAILNQYPLIAPYLMTSGLVFMVDCRYECSSALWKDLIGTAQFVGHGMSLINGVPQFGSGYYTSNDSTIHYLGGNTIEAVYRPKANIGGYSFIYKENGNSVAMSYAQQGTLVVASGIDASFIHNAYANTLYSTSGFFASSDNHSVYANGNRLQKTWWSFWSARDGKYIGARSESEAKFYGEIYAIRIYNRRLSDSEMQAHQAIDLQMFSSL